MKTVDVLAIGAHMGDEVAWGMTLASQVRQGLKVGLLYLTPGEKGHRTLSADAYEILKREESAACAEILGAETWSLPYRDGELPVSHEVKWAIADVIREARPRLVITHWHGSIHKDHTNSHLNLPDARFFAGVPAFVRSRPAHWVGQVLYAENWEDLRDFVPEVYVRVTAEDVDVWERAMRCYALFRGEVSDFPYLDYYRALARTRGCEAGCEFACAFAVPPEARKKVLDRLVEPAG